MRPGLVARPEIVFYPSGQWGPADIPPAGLPVRDHFEACDDPTDGPKTPLMMAAGRPGPATAAAPAGEFADTPPCPGAVELGHYDVLETIGRGGFGVVVRAFDRKLHRVVAVKMMGKELAATSPARRRFVREARAAAAVRHPNVVQIHAVEERPLPHLVMEYVPGGSLQQLLSRSGPLGVADILRVGAQVARGLAAAHATGLVHRDIKPANILLESGSDLRVKITDFGLARAADDASLTQSGAVAGTPEYMAPEQARGEAVDHRADLFSLGSVLYALACGHPPFRAANSLAVLKRVDAAAPRPVREVVPETPGWLCDVIARLQARNPGDRFQSAGEVAAVLDACLADLERGRAVRPLVGLRAGRRLAASAAGAVLCGAVVTVLGLWPRPTLERPGAAEATAVQPPALGAYRNVIGMEFVPVPAGRSMLGGGGGVAGQRAVEVPYDFYLGKYEVTRGEWEAVMGPGTDPSRYARTGAHAAAVADVPDDELRGFPVEGVSWHDCQEFVRRLNRLAGEAGWVYRLPTATEWEYACRNGPGQAAEELGFDFYAGGPGRPVPVGSYPPNRLGLHDLHGNAFEFLDDLARDDTGGRLLAGGFWADNPDQCRAAFRGWCYPDRRPDGAGLRLARVPAGPAGVTARQQYEAVVADLRRLNPGFDAATTPTIVEDRVVGLAAAAAGPVRDLSPLQELRHLRVLEIPWGRFGDLTPLRGLPLREVNFNNNTAIRDLTPLKGMPLENLQIWGFSGHDLSPLKGMPLRGLNCGGGEGRLDLSQLKGLPLEVLCVNNTLVDDLLPLAGLPLRELLIERTRVADLSPLRGMRLTKLAFEGARVTDWSLARDMPIEELTLNFVPARDTDILRAIPTLKRINAKPAAEFWKGIGPK